MQNNKLLSILILIMLVILVGVIGVSIFKEFEFNNTDVKDNALKSDSTDVDVLEVSSKEIKDIVTTFNILPMLDDENLLNVLFSGEASFSGLYNKAGLKLQ